MPLPSNTSLSLLGYSRPGDALQSKPKKAMLVRLSSETLDALESFSSHPQVQFEFGENPGLYIGEEHFPMRHSPENTIHELFLRASSASKKSAPLKLHANVVGKFTVERELADQLRDKIRESTQDAANQRNSRSTVFIDTPPDLQTNSRKRKEPPSTMFRKPIRPSDKLKPPATSSGQYATNQGPSTSQLKDNSNAARKRIIQHLALNSEATEEKLLQIVNVPDRNISSSRHLAELLDQIAETTATKGKPTESAKTYRLKPVTWKEVRPFEWSALNEQEQTKIARQARGIFQHILKIPENDPIWEHVRYKSITSTGFLSSEGKSSADPRRGSTTVIPPSEEVVRSRVPDIPKRGLSSRDAKEKKSSRQRSDVKGEIMMKDERSGTTAIHKTASHSEQMLNESDIRRISDAPLADSAMGRTQVSLPPKPTRTFSTQTDKDQGKLSSSKSKVAQTRQSEKNTSTGSSKLPPASASSQDDRSSGLSKSKKALRDEDRTTLESEKIRRPQQPESSKVNATGSDVRDHSKTVKRKLGDQADPDSHDPSLVSNPTKRLKSDYSESPSRKEDNPIIKKEARQLDRLPPRKVQPPSSLKSRRSHDSPPPPPQQLKRQTITSSRDAEKASSESLPSSRSHTTGSQSGKPAGPTKSRRRSPIYTSSSEDEDTPPTGYRSGIALASGSDKKSPSHIRNNNSPALPTDHTSLRARYTSSYLEYLSVFQRLVIEKGKIDSLLKNESANTGVGTDSDGDTDLMDPDELSKLTMTHKELQEELERIQSIFGRTSVDLSTDLLP